jgi:hypothetical protein
MLLTSSGNFRTCMKECARDAQGDQCFMCHLYSLVTSFQISPSLRILLMITGSASFIFRISTLYGTVDSSRASRMDANYHCIIELDTFQSMAISISDVRFCSPRAHEPNKYTLAGLPASCFRTTSFTRSKPWICIHGTFSPGSSCS